MDHYHHHHQYCSHLYLYPTFFLPLFVQWVTTFDAQFLRKIVSPSFLTSPPPIILPTPCSTHLSTWGYHVITNDWILPESKFQASHSPINFSYFSSSFPLETQLKQSFDPTRTYNPNPLPFQSPHPQVVPTSSLFKLQSYTHFLAYSLNFIACLWLHYSLLTKL